MKNLTLLLMAISLMLLSFSGVPQSRYGIRKANENTAVRRPSRGGEDIKGVVGAQNYNPTTSAKSVLDDPSTAVTTYDLQTNASTMNRIYRYPDGTIGTVSTWSATTSGSTFPDRGTGYNYFNGSAWGAPPTARIETSVRTGWPSYAPFGANGEIVLSHNFISGSTLVMSTRTTKGTGNWNVTQPTALGPPSGASVMVWPRMVTNGNPRTNIHIIALTMPTANGGTAYQGMDGALLYNRSTDGGVTWLGWQQLPGITSSQYLGIGPDAYNWAEPMGDTLAFVVGDSWNDEFIMKSTNNGTTWTKTIVWQCPYDLWPGTTNTDTFYCSDGSNAVAMDRYGKVHVAFGRQRAVGDNTGAKYWFPFTDGVIYWDENLAELPQSLDENALRSGGNWVGYVKDTNVFYQAATQLAWYYTSMSSFPAIVMDHRLNNIYLVYSSVTTLLDPNNYMLRHLFLRISFDNGINWCDSIFNITDNFFQYHWEECVYPSVSPTRSDTVFVLFQGDLEAGVYLNGINPGVQGQVEITNNDMFLNAQYIPWLEEACFGGINQQKSQPEMIVFQNTPNPFKLQTQVNVTLSVKGDLSLEVYSLLGQKVVEIDKGNVNPGDYQFVLHGSQFTPGIYFYTVRCNNETSTHKMIVL